MLVIFLGVGGRGVVLHGQDQPLLLCLQLLQYPLFLPHHIFQLLAAVQNNGILHLVDGAHRDQTAAVYLYKVIA